VKRITVMFVISFVLAMSAVFASGVTSAASAFKAVTASTTYPGVPNAYGYAVYIITPTGSGNVNYGPSVPVVLSCTTPPATNTVTNSGPALPSNTLVGSGSAVSTITINRTTTSLSVQTSEDIHTLRLLGGVIAANEIHAVVTSTATTAGATSANSSSFSGLTVAGLPINSKPAPNTSLALPGFGSIILNEQSGPFNGAKTTSIGVIMMDIRITALNAAGLAPGTRIVIAFVQSAIQPSAVHAVSYSLYASGLGGSTPAIGPVAVAGTSCQGGSSTVGLNGYTVPVVGNTGNETSSASGAITSSSATATAQNSISNVNLLGGLITADKIGTTASASWNGGGSRSGSATFVNVKVNGSLLPSNLAPNTRENLPGIGYVIVNEQYGSSNASEATENVIGIDIYITVSNNSVGLAVGTRIVVSLASASAASY
jgi:hypothetical protein